MVWNLLFFFVIRLVSLVVELTQNQAQISICESILWFT